ncbi:GIY-YIG nuclease family protein [Colwellia demingiae]|uniref:GIY-YIG nuclease family protein n=2 Tax=Colwellia demingiae TaxID=89401 RepID=A0A5C6QLN1_9GAMM|nr:GIY-YIG nuclease family protein [Colwellia demingiae]
MDSTTRVLKIGYNNRSKFRALLKIIGSIYPMKNTENTTDTTTEKDISLGNVYVMTHSFFSDVVKIGCTTEDPQEHAKSLSAKTIGEYTVAFSLQCNNPCKVKKQIKKYLNAEKYVNEFYQVSPEVAEKLLRRETLVIPSLNSF